MLHHVATQIAGVAVAGVALQTHEGPLPGVNPHVDLQVTFLLEALQALVTPVRLFAGVGTHVDSHLGIVGENPATHDTRPAPAAAPRPSPLLTVDEPLAAVQALGGAVVRRQHTQGLQFGLSVEGVMAVHRQWGLPLPVDTQDPQLLAVTGHVEGARGVHMQTL